MKMLLISDNKIFGFGGGCLEEKKYYDGLKKYAQKNNIEFKVISPDEKISEKLDLSLKKNKIIDIYVRLKGHSSYIYYNFRINKNKFKNYAPNIVIIGRSRFGYIAKFYKKINPKCKIICNMENVEYDYVDGYFSNNKSIIKKLYVEWEKLCVKRDEKMALKYSDAINFLSLRDKKRTYELYKIKNKKEMILPICLENSRELYLKSNVRNIVFVGSLNYESNVRAVINFIDNVWIKYFNNNTKLNLIIAGSNPTKDIEERVKRLDNCIIHKNFKTLEDIIPKHSLMIAPIEKGAGMKVKVAETLSMGLPIVASDEALVGYELALENCINNSIMRANSDNEYVNAINNFITLSDKQLNDIEVENKKLFEKYYSYNVSRNKIAKLCQYIINSAER